MSGNPESNLEVGKTHPVDQQVTPPGRQASGEDIFARFRNPRPPIDLSGVPDLPWDYTDFGSDAVQSTATIGGPKPRAPKGEE